MNTADLIASAKPYNETNADLEELALHVITSAKPTFESQLGYLIAYYAKTKSGLAAALLAGLCTVCPPRLLPAVVERITNSTVLAAAALRALQNNFKIVTHTIVESLQDNGHETDQLIEDIVSFEVQKAAEAGASPPFAISQAMANDVLVALQQNSRLLLENYHFLPILLSASGEAGELLTKQIAFFHLEVDYTRLIENLIESGIPFDFAAVYDVYSQNVRSVVVFAKLAVLAQKTATAANELLFMLQNESEVPVAQCVEAFRLLIAFDFSSNAELFQAVMNLGKLISMFEHFIILAKDIAKNVKQSHQGYNYLRQYISLIIEFVQSRQEPSHVLQLLNQIASSFSLSENAEVFGNSLETLSFVSHSKSCKLEQFCDAYLAWTKAIENVHAEKANLQGSLEFLINCTRRIDISDFDESTYMLVAQKCMLVVQAMDDRSKLRFLTNLHANIDEKHENNAVYAAFVKNLEDSNLEDIVMNAKLQNIDAYTNYIAVLLPSEEVKRPVALLVEKVASLLTLPDELQIVVIQLLSAFIVRFPDVLGEKTKAIFDILISQMLKNRFEQNLCFKIICAYYQVNNSAISLFEQANFPVKYQVRFIAKYLNNYADYKDTILQALMDDNGKARQAAVDIVFRTVEQGISYNEFVMPNTELCTIKFMTYYCFRLGELYNASFEDSLRKGTLLELPADFADFGAFLMQNGPLSQNVLTYIEVLFCNASSEMIASFLNRFGYQLYEVSLTPRLRFQIRRVFVAAGLCVGRELLSDQFALYLDQMQRELGDFSATHYARRLERKVLQILRKVPAQSFPGRYEANTYIMLNLPVPPRLRSQLASTAYNDELVDLKAGTTQAQIDEIFEEKSESEENVAEFLEQALHKEDQNAILDNIKTELEEIRARKAAKQTTADFGDRYKNRSSGGDLVNKGKPVAKIPLNARVDVKDLRKIRRADKIGDEKLRRAVQERALKGREANPIRSKKVEGGRKRIQAAYRHATDIKTHDRRRE